LLFLARRQNKIMPSHSTGVGNRDGVEITRVRAYCPRAESAWSAGGMGEARAGGTMGLTLSAPVDPEATYRDNPFETEQAGVEFSGVGVVKPPSSLATNIRNPYPLRFEAPRLHPRLSASRLVAPLAD